MGKNVTTQSIDQVANYVLSEIESSTFSSKEKTTNINDINITNCTGNIASITQENITELNITDVSAAVAKNLSDANIQNKAKELAKIIQGFLASDTNKTNQLIKQIVNLSVTMRETYIDDVNGKFLQENSFTCKGSSLNITNGVVQENYMKAAVQTISNNSQVQASKTALGNTADQSSSIVTKGLFGPLNALIALLGTIVIIVILLIVVGTVGGGLHSVSVVMIIVFALFALAVYNCIGFFPKWWPYEATSVIDTTEEKDSKNKRNLAIFFVSLGIAILFAAIFVFLLLHHSSKKSPKKSEVTGTIETKRSAEIRELRNLEKVSQLQGAPSRQAPDLPSKILTKDRLRSLEDPKLNTLDRDLLIEELKKKLSKQ